MKKIRLLSKRIVIIFAAALILAAGIRVIGAYRNNYLTIYLKTEKSESFPKKFADNGIYSPYKEGIPLYEMDLSEVLLPGAAGLLRYPDAPPITDSTTVLRHSIKYYEKVGRKYVPVYEIPAGTRVIVLEEEGKATSRLWNMFYYGYALGSMPTYERSWRYSTPFKIVVDGKVQPSNISGKRYVKLRDLEAVMDQVYEQQAFLPYLAESEGYSGDFLKKALLLYLDSGLFSSGNYRSPDFYHPYFDTPNIALLSAGGALLVAHVGARAYLRRKRKDD